MKHQEAEEIRMEIDELPFNSSWNDTVDYTFDIETENPENPAVIKVCNVLTAIIYLIGFAGNSFVCCVITRRKQMQTPLNIILLSLAVGDIFLILTESVAQVLGLDSYTGFNVSETSCVWLMYLVTFGYYIVAIQVAIPLVINLFYPRIRKLYSIIVTAAAWLSAAALAVPHGMAATLVTFSSEKTICIHQWGTDAIHLWFEYLIILTPLNILMVCLFIQKCVLKRSLNRMFLLLIVIYIACLANFTILKIFLSLTPERLSFEVVFLWFKFSRIFFDMIVVYKPILLILYDADFERIFKATFMTRRSAENFELI